jgi:transcriptional regulator GlxA family with amidase domain
MNFGIVIFPQVEELDFVGPWEMVTMWKKEAQGPENCLIVAQTTQPVLCSKGLSVNPHVSFEGCPALDFLLVPGGQGTRTEVNNPALINFIAEQATHCRMVLSVCTGAFLLHRAGLLKGKRATTHWGSLDRLRALGDVMVVEERWVRDGNVWSSAGVSAGIDLTLAVIAEVAGEETAGKVQFDAEYYPEGRMYGKFYKSEKAPQYVRRVVST